MAATLAVNKVCGLEFWTKNDDAKNTDECRALAALKYVMYAFIKSDDI